MVVAGLGWFLSLVYGQVRGVASFLRSALHLSVLLPPHPASGVGLCRCGRRPVVMSAVHPVSRSSFFSAII